MLNGLIQFHSATSRGLFNGIRPFSPHHTRSRYSSLLHHRPTPSSLFSILHRQPEMGEMDKLSLIESPLHQFSIDEVMELERMYQEMGEKSFDQDFCQEIAMSFSSSSNRAGNTSISWQQVQCWFQNKQKESAHVTSSPGELKLFVGLSDASNGHKSSPTPKGNQVTDLSELAYEARSSKDLAWHDVSLFINYRIMSTGELEARVRYAGYSKEQDEWVNVKEGVRERSIPLVASECHKVNNGDLVLCFMETDDYALYCDARVVKIQRAHDRTECRCIFTVRFLHDNTEQAVSWNKLCCRPTQEEPMVSVTPINSIESLWG